jgi:hypothetical protein
VTVVESGVLALDARFFLIAALGAFVDEDFPDLV